MDSHIISEDIEALERELSDLRARVEQDTSAFTTLEEQVGELRERLDQTRESVGEHEDRLAAKQEELAAAKRVEALTAYRENLGSHQEAAARVVRAATDLLSELEAYDNETLSLRRLVEAMRDAFGDDERVAEVESVLAQEPEEVRRSFEALVAEIRWRIDDQVEDDLVDATKQGLAAEEEDDLPTDLRGELAQARRRARIKEYFRS